jgi:hypothetical protein
MLRVNPELRFFMKAEIETLKRRLGELKDKMLEIRGYL